MEIDTDDRSQGLAEPGPFAPHPTHRCGWQPRMLKMTLMMYKTEIFIDNSLRIRSKRSDSLRIARDQEYRTRTCVFFGVIAAAPRIGVLGSILTLS